MKKIFLKLSPDNDGYGTVQEAQTKNFALRYLVFFLEQWGDSELNNIKIYNDINCEWLSLTKMPDNKHVYLWNTDSIKKQAAIPDLTPAEQYAFDNEYEIYREKAWDDMSKLIMTTENYIEVVHKWQKIVLGLQPAYFILSQNDAGYVDLIGKDELSEQDLQDMKIEHEKYLKYEKARQAYDNNQHDYSEAWRGPQDNEFEEDVMKYYKD